MIKVILKSILIISFGLAAGCSWFDGGLGLYKTEKVQGNILTQSEVNKLKPGMTKDQVRFLLGSPMITDSFYRDRWDYIYRLDTADGRKDRKRLTLFFDNNKLQSLKGNIVPQQ